MKVFGISYHVLTIAIGINEVLIVINIGAAITLLAASIVQISREAQALTLRHTCYFVSGNRLKTRL